MYIYIYVYEYRGSSEHLVESLRKELHVYGFLEEEPDLYGVYICMYMYVCTYT
jgi:hypothetical protein